MKKGETTMKGTSLKHIELPVTTHSKGRNGESVTAIVVHHNAGNLTLQEVQNVFKNRKSSAHYDIDVNGNIAQYVDESDRSWCTSGANPDNHTITIELANTSAGVNNKTWEISDSTMNAAIALCADICERYGIAKLYYDGKKGTLLRHCDYSSTACPGKYFIAKTDLFCSLVNAKMAQDAQISPENPAKTNESAGDDKIYRVQAGAFKSAENAAKQAASLNAAGFQAIIKEVSK